ncbi:hypothetical protein FA13DRAFT_1802538 [Coprinellus micaceus]|uniref:Uncharacterized protein n=1 Tax=Coprinellus micaceus TaxID=71717 RepID=A0A4Y7SBY2_COPMI|nr:hypothetical protein FA13DRAFT_1802538 [Coprinellus micaceus]
MSRCLEIEDVRQHKQNFVTGGANFNLNDRVLHNYSLVRGSRSTQKDKQKEKSKNKGKEKESGRGLYAVMDKVKGMMPAEIHLRLVPGRGSSPRTRSPSPLAGSPSPLAGSPSPLTRSPTPLTRSPSPLRDLPSSSQHQEPHFSRFDTQLNPSSASSNVDHLTSHTPSAHASQDPVQRVLQPSYWMAAPFLAPEPEHRCRALVDKLVLHLQVGLGMEP